MFGKLQQLPATSSPPLYEALYDALSSTKPNPCTPSSHRSSETQYVRTKSYYWREIGDGRAAGRCPPRFHRFCLDLLPCLVAPTGEDAHVCTFLLDVKPSDVEPPLGQFQATNHEKDDVQKLLETIYQKVIEADEKVPSNEVLTQTFEQFWPQLHEKLDQVSPAAAGPASPKRNQDEVLDEILTTVRRLEREGALQLWPQLASDDVFGLRALTQQKRAGALRALGGSLLKPRSLEDDK